MFAGSCPYRNSSQKCAITGWEMRKSDFVLGCLFIVALTGTGSVPFSEPDALCLACICKLRRAGAIGSAAVVQCLGELGAASSRVPRRLVLGPRDCWRG